MLIRGVLSTTGEKLRDRSIIDRDVLPVPARRDAQTRHECLNTSLLLLLRFAVLTRDCTAISASLRILLLRPPICDENTKEPGTIFLREPRQRLRPAEIFLRSHRDRSRR